MSKVTTEELLADIRRVIAATGERSSRVYDRHAADGCSARLAIHRHGSWTAAVRAATDNPREGLRRLGEAYDRVRESTEATLSADAETGRTSETPRAALDELTREAERLGMYPASHDSRTIAIVSDIHFDLHDEATWYAFREWHAFVRPKHTVILGDFVDLGMLSKYEQGPDEPLFAVPQIQMFVREANALLKECDVLTICMGNHDDRWAKALGCIKPYAFKGAVGLSLREQCELQGLERSNRVRWFTEGKDGPALYVAGFALHHGHTKGGKWGGPKHLAASLLDKGNGQSQIVGHSHRAQLFMRGAFGKQSVAIANPAMCRPMTYANDPDWQRGWTALSMLAPDYTDVVPHVLIAKDGRVAWGGRTFGVRERVAA